MVTATRSKVKVYYHHHHPSASICACNENFLLLFSSSTSAWKEHRVEDPSSKSSPWICRNNERDASVNAHVHVFCMHEINPCRFTTISIHNCQVLFCQTKKHFMEFIFISFRMRETQIYL